METNIILVCLDNFQEYIITNINQLIRLKHTSIYVITNEKFFNKFDQFNCIKLIDVVELNDTFNFKSKTQLDSTFRGGFWMLTSLRFFYIYELMKKLNISNVFHIENDVLLYYNCNILNNTMDKVHIPFDTFQRNIASIIFIPNHEIFFNILSKYDFTNNDMYNFQHILNTTNYIDTFPIFVESDNSDEVKFVTKNYKKFGFIFDAAAMGQYLGGIDPRNQSGNTVGFINETCVIKYNNYKFLWKEINFIKKPFIKYGEHIIPIFNLHIHSKNLINFV